MTAKKVAALVTGNEPPLDVSDLSAKRFEKGELVYEPSVIG
jgi:glycine/D-amino acid oxidase-like deaminating enzyme